MINVIKASAGSGKTYQLTYEYIKLLLGEKRKGRYTLAHEWDKERHRHILAVTFTNKATGEMKERIVKELSILAGKVQGKTSPYMSDLCRDFGGVSVEAIEKAANRALVELLFDYSNFNVSTIDSFFQMILRTFAKELKISYNYDIELNDEYAIKVGVNDFLSSLAHERGTAVSAKEAKRARRAKSWIKEFVRDEVTNKKSWNIFTDSEAVSTSSASFSKSFSFSDFAKCLTKEDLKYRIDDIVAYLGYDESSDENASDYIAEFKRALYGLVQSMKKEAVAAKQEIMRLSAADGLHEEDVSNNGGLKWLLGIADDSFDCGLDSVKTEKIRASKEKGDKWFKKSKGKNAPALSEATKAAIAEQIEIIARCNSRFLIYKDIHRNVYMLGLLGEISHYLSKFRKDNDLILLADTNELLRKIINNDETPFVYERVGMWLDHFLIDEFQDTSRAQWENMKPLLFNSCAEGSDNLIIGDEKQCIYRFRNADPTLLRTEVGRNFTVMQNDSGKCVNWRSTPRVVEFNNNFFTELSETLGVTDVYGNVVQDLPPAGKKTYANDGYVEVNFIEKESQDGLTRKFADVVLERLPQLIQDIISRGYKQKDIAVLVSTNKEGADVIQRILDYNATKDDDKPAINVVSNESLMLKNSPAVRLIISHLRYLDTKVFTSDRNEETMAYKDLEGYMHRVLRNYETLMFKEGVQPGEALENSFASVPRHVDNSEISLSNLLPDNTESFSIVSITEHIIAQNITAEDLENENAFIQAFQDSVVDFSGRFNATIHEFLKWWDKGGCNTSVNSPDGQNAINVLTIHKSKGLEYKCVILPLCDWDMNGKEEVLWIPKEVALQSELFSSMDNDIVPPVIPLMPKNDMDLPSTGLKNFCNEKLLSRQIDSLNRTYVAFTRAVDELYVFTPSPEEKGTANTSMNTLLSTLPLQEDGCTYVSGKKGTVRDEQPRNGAETLEKMPLYKVQDVKIEYTVPDMADNENRERGNRLHNVFKRIRFKDDADTALRYFKAKGAFPRGSYDDDCLAVKAALDDERVQSWFDPRNKVYNERSMVRAFKKSRPDRFITTPDGKNIVIDYKFGEIHSPSYRKQVKEYVNILGEIGFENVEGYLWYPLERKIEKVV